MKPHEQYPNLYKVCLEIALDNGGIHRDRSQEIQKTEFDTWTGTQDDHYLSTVDTWLGTLSEDDRSTIATGEVDDRIMIMESNPMAFPDCIDGVLNSYFDEVC